MFSGSALLDVFRSPQVSGANVCELDSADCSSHRDQTISSNPAAMSRQNRDPFRATANRQCVAALRARSPKVGNFVSLHSSSYCLRHMMDINATLFPFPFNVIPCHCRASTLYLQALYGYNVDTSVDKHPFACLEVDQHQQVDDLPPSPRYLNWSHACAMQMPAASHKFHPRILIHPSLLFFSLSYPKEGRSIGSESGGDSYPAVRSVPRFVPVSNTLQSWCRSPQGTCSCVIPDPKWCKYAPKSAA